MARNEFKAPKYHQFEIVNDGRIVGTLRVKPAALLWKPKGARTWRGVDLEEFAKWIEAQGGEFAH